MSEVPDKMTLTAFSTRAKGEIDRTKFAAVSGGLVTLSALTYWELLYAAQAWHEHLQAPQAFIVTPGSLDATSFDLQPGVIVLADGAQVVQELREAGAPAEVLALVSQAGATVPDMQSDQ